jgi:hypothetical protein
MILLQNGDQIMGKHENGKFLEKKKARKAWNCIKCRRPIKPGEGYYRETLGLINPSPGTQFYSYCVECGPKSGIPITD